MEETKTKPEIKFKAEEVKQTDRFIRQFTVKFEKLVGWPVMRKAIIASEINQPKGEQHPTDKQLELHRVGIYPIVLGKCRVKFFYRYKKGCEPKPEKAEIKKPAREKKDKQRWSFPKDPECPRCHARDTIATSTQGKFQYRRCRRAICRHNFVVVGTKI